MSNHNKETEARCFHCYRHYVEGTAAWALYMMRMGHEITNPMYDPRVYYLPEGGMIHINGVETIAGNLWVDYWCIDIPDGWEVYEEQVKEPKPLLADAQVGDLCQLRNKTYITIGKIQAEAPQYTFSDNISRNENGCAYGVFMALFDIIHTEPLAPEGSAEWAWQMLKLGKPVTNKWVFTAGGYIKDTDSDKYRFVQMWDFFSGWQLYEPKPKPKFAVGDWVEIEVSGVLSQQQATSGAFADSIKCGGVNFYANGNPVMQPLNARIIRKLSPSEVIVKIGCLKGTVEKAQDYAYFLLWHSKTDCDYSMIKWSAIDTPTREMVERLLKAQEDK